MERSTVGANSLVMTDTDDLRRVAAAFSAAAATLVSDGDLPAIAFSAPRNADFGDFASNIALVLARRARRAPQVLAQTLIERVFSSDPSLRSVVIDATAVAGFVNIRMAPEFWQRVVGQILHEGSAFGRGAATGCHISLEFGSANPTGPLVVVQGRSLAIGATLTNAMRFVGHQVTAEWIINDAGNQFEGLGRSLYARYRQLADPAYPFPADGYPGDYLIAIAQTIRERDGDRWDDDDEAMWLPHFSAVGRDTLVAQQRATCSRYGIEYDNWQSEKVLHEAGQVSAALAALGEKGLTYEKDRAVWLRSTQFGDDQDRVLIRSDSRPTYVASDAAYQYDKLQRGADSMILILGPDHHGYIKRLETLAAAFGKPGSLEVIIAQQMTLQAGTELISMSKRAGHIITLDDILDEVGVDATRFFFVLASPDSPMTFDLSLAKEQSNENPVYYVQYGHARIASIERKAGPDLLAAAESGASLERLNDAAELALARKLAEFPSVVRSVADHRAPQHLARFAREVAGEFHQFYTRCMVLSDDRALTVARLGLAHATRLVLANSLQLLGVSAPEAM